MTINNPISQKTKQNKAKPGRIFGLTLWRVGRLKKELKLGYQADGLPCWSRLTSSSLAALVEREHLFPNIPIKP